MACTRNSGRLVQKICMGSLWSALGLVILAVANAQGGSWTWNGKGANDNWSCADNWTPAGPPASDNASALIFDGQSRTAPCQDLAAGFLFGKLQFATNAGSFHLGGTTNFLGQSAWRSLQFSGSNTSISVFGGGQLLIQGALVTPDSAATQTIAVAAGMQLQVPWIKGGVRRVVVKKGCGLLRIFEPADGQCYLEKSSTVGPEYRVEDGVVELGTRTNRMVLASSGNGWRTAPAEVKASYNLTVGDGMGAATSAVFRLMGPPQSQVIDNNLAITVNADGLLDLGGVQDWDPTGACCLLVSNGVVRTASNSVFVRNGRTLELYGNARIEGDGCSAIRFYDGATNQVDGLGTCAVMSASAALIQSANAAGVVFQVTGSTGDVVALEVSGHLGAGGAGSHLVKRGVGTMAIANLTHAVRTNRVENGTLLLNGISRCGSSSTGAQWLVTAHATLGGCGIISNAPVVVQGGAIDPGDAAGGTLTIEQDLALASGSTMIFDLTAVGPGTGRLHDQLVIQKGTLTGLSNATLRIDIHDHLNLDGQTFRIISGGGDLTGQTFQSVLVTGRSGRRAAVYAGNGFVDITVRNARAGTGVMLR